MEIRLNYIAKDECETLKEAEETSQAIKGGKEKTYSIDEAEAMIGDTAMEEHEKNPDAISWEEFEKELNGRIKGGN